LELLLITAKPLNQQPSRQDQFTVPHVTQRQVGGGLPAGAFAPV